jgi:hypothetical protein
LLPPFSGLLPPFSGLLFPFSGLLFPFSGLLFLPGAPQAGARHRVSARSPGVMVGPRVSRGQDTAAPSARLVR